MIYHVDRLNAQIINEGPHGEDNSPPPRQNHPYGEVIKSISKWKWCVLWPQNELLCTFARNESGMVITGQIVEISCSLLNLCLQIS